MFFALSGFLITYLLCFEKEMQEVSVSRFYLRRILRIWPLYYGYLIIVLLIYFIYEIEFNSSSLPFYIFFGANIPYVVGASMPLLVHYWSLGVEEQFYIFWPWINRLKIKTIGITTLALIVALIGSKLFLHFGMPGTSIEYFLTISRFQCMLIGSLAALLYYSKINLIIRFATHPIVQFICWSTIVLVAINKYHIASVVDQEIVTVITSALILGQVEGKGIVNLENRVFDFLGRISYGIYVIHPMIIYMLVKFLRPNSSIEVLNYIFVFTTVVAGTVFFAYLSYRYFESPFLRLKSQKFSTIKSLSSGFGRNKF